MCYFCKISITPLYKDTVNLIFYKYQGAGNDFIIVDNRNAQFPVQDYKLIHKLCNRRFGIGADGLMLLQKHQDYDFEMLYYNADGMPGSMCGNGGRCITAFANYLGVIKNETNFLAVDGPHYAKFSAKNVSLQMIDVKHIEDHEHYWVLNTGSPHYVGFTSDVKALDVAAQGRAIRYNNRFKDEGINVNFVQELGPRQLFVRTYERGVEDETLSCGTGITAAALCYGLKQQLMGQQAIAIDTPGGKINVKFNQVSKGYFEQVFLEGPAELIYEGNINTQNLAI